MNVISREAAAQSWTEPRFRMLSGRFELLRRFGAKLGPYVLLEVLLPGGTLFALFLFLYQRSKAGRGIDAMQPEGIGEERWWNARLGIVRSAQADAQPNF